MNIPNDIIEYILILREVYVVMKHEFDFENSTTSCQGIYGNIHEAKQSIINYVLKEDLTDFEYYDPKKRYHSSHEEEDQVKIWYDRWENSRGIHRYSIETWKQNCIDGRTDQIVFGFDSYLKSLIIEKKLTSVETRNMLLDWKLSPPLNTFIQLFSDYTTFNRKIFERSTPEIRIAWQEKHGYIEAYPYRRDDNIDRF